MFSSEIIIFNEVRNTLGNENNTDGNLDSHKLKSHKYKAKL